jgi:2-octaprenyl-6-methoxyphenol hydroxylase
MMAVTKEDPIIVDAVVVGAGPAGLTAALALAGAGLRTILLGRAAPVDNRTTALLSSSVMALEALGVWEACREHGAPLKRLRIVDDTQRLFRAPEARFAAKEINLDAFAWNIENRHLVAALEDRAEALSDLIRIRDDARAVDLSSDHVSVRTAGGQTIQAALAVASDGAKSICRQAAGIETKGWSYPQIALTFTVAHSRPHDDISTEFHTESGPFTTVPLPGLRSAIVCVVSPDEAEHIRALAGEALDQEIERRSHGILGKVSVQPGSGSFPLAVETAKTFAANRVMLVGESGHRIPPIGAQGLNLGLRDAATVAELVISARHDGDDIGGDEVLARYERMRRADVASRTFAVDLLNRSLLSSFLPLQGMRGIGLYLLNSFGPLRRAVMREGVAPVTSQPRLMRGEQLV